TFPITVRVTDNGTPALSDNETIQITVSNAPPANQPPVLTTIGPKSVTAGTSLAFTAQAQDPDGNTLAFGLDAGAPAGATINAASGAFTWTPTAAQVGTFPITVRVTDNGTPPLSDSETIQVTVNAVPPVNQPPVLTA